MDAEGRPTTDTDKAYHGLIMPLEQYLGRMDKLVGMAKSAAPAAGYDEVLVAGEPEIRFERERRAKGVPILSGVC